MYMYILKSLRQVNTWNICSPCSTLFGSWKNDNYIWKVVKRNSKFITIFISFSQKFCIVQMIFWCCFWGFYFCLVFFLKGVGMGVKGVNKHVQHYYAKVGRRKTARSFLTDSDHQKIRNATGTFHLDFLGNPALKKKNYKVSAIIN